jgi:hypothetical protein
MTPRTVSTTPITVPRNVTSHSWVCSRAIALVERLRASWRRVHELMKYEGIRLLSLDATRET